MKLSTAYLVNYINNLSCIEWPRLLNVLATVDYKFNFVMYCLFRFFVLVIVYLVGGVLYMRFVRGATGIEMVPNLEFWKEVPALVKVMTAIVQWLKGYKTKN